MGQNNHPTYVGLQEKKMKKEFPNADKLKQIFLHSLG